MDPTNSVRLQQHANRTKAGKTYIKHVIVIPSHAIEKLGWSDVHELAYKLKERTLILKPSD